MSENPHMQSLLDVLVQVTVREIEKKQMNEHKTEKPTEEQMEK